MRTKITPDLIKAYTQENKRHKLYADSIKIMNRIKVHADGEYPGDIIDERRPNESEENKKYRKKIYVEITKETVSRILTALCKIRKSPDWTTIYPKDQPKRLNEGETLQAYLEKSFPIFKHIDNYVFDVLLKQYLIDPNGVVAIMPLYQIEGNELVQPFPFVFNSNQVLEYRDKDFCLLQSTDKAEYTEEGNTYRNGNVFYVINTDRIQQWRQIDTKGTLSLNFEYVHNLGEMPVFKLGGVIKKAEDASYLFESRIDAIVPRLTEAVREYSDLQIDVVMNIHSEKWEYENECSDCGGHGKVIKNETSVTCAKCKGTGSEPESPFKKTVIKRQMVGEVPVPNPPKGYIFKQPELIKIQDDRIEKHIYRALSAINMHFLEQTPANQSGYAKDVDRDEVTTFYNSIAEDIVNRKDKLIYFITQMRYKVIIPEDRLRISMLPTIPVPDRFDVLSSTMLIKEIQEAKTAKINPVLISAMEVELASKKYAHDPSIKTLLENTILLDPFPSMSREEKDNMLLNGGVSKVDYVISCYIYDFVRRAMNEDQNFALMKLSDKQKKIETYAQEKLKKIDNKAKVLEMVPPADEEEAA